MSACKLSKLMRGRKLHGLRLHGRCRRGGVDVFFMIAAKSIMFSTSVARTGTQLHEDDDSKT